MRRFFCQCGQAIYFENQQCGACGRQLAFDADALQMRVLGSDSRSEDGRDVCANRGGAVRCNWLLARGFPAGDSCISCSTSRISPSLAKRASRERWRKLEMAKRRLLYDLLSLNLPIDTSRLSFVFKEDRRTNPDVYEEHVSIGHASGEITINAAEADDTYRAKMRQMMNEPYRTLLGHFRHESGHYYFRLVVGDRHIEEARALFGDERTDYAAALRRHYADGPRENWWADYISSYASTHPSEDWAETWAHYLHIHAVLETASVQDLLGDKEEQSWNEAFVDFMLKINEVSRSLGLPDAYPFVLTTPVVAKLDLVRRLIAEQGNRDPA
jgi:hypothetical protein